MKTIVVYKTDVDNLPKAQKVMAEILQRLEGVNLSFDLEDHDNVLRVESLNGKIDKIQIYEIVKNAGHQIEELT